jgi:hypothetical protein
MRGALELIEHPAKFSELAYRIVAASVEGVDDAGAPVVVDTSRVGWLPGVEVVTASAAKRGERESAHHRETMIAIGVIGAGFAGTRPDLEDALVAAGVPQARVRVVQRRVSVANRVSGGRNSNTWVVRDAIVSGVQASGAGVLVGAGLDDLGPMVADVDARVWAGV